MDHTIIHFAILWTLTTIFVPGGQCAIRAELEEHLFAISQLNREPFDLAFVFDITDSMLNDLQQVRIATATILEDVFFKSDFTIENYVLVPFRDPEVGPAQVTSSKSEFEKMLGRLEVYGGSDCMEPSIEAIKQALEACQPKSFIFVFTDAPPKDIQFVDDVIELVQATQSKVIFVLTDGCDNEFGVFHKIAKISKGGFCPLEDQIQANLVVNCIHLSVRGNQVSTLYQTDPVSTLFTAPVDSCLEDLLFTVTSEREVSIVNVYTPAGHRLSKKTLDRRTTKVTEVETPIIGEWSMDVFARRTFTVHIGGHSVCDFDPTFVYNLKPTSYYLRPTVGKLTYIVMNATIPRSGKTKCNCTGARVSTISILQLNGDDIEIFDVDWVVGQDFQVSQALSFVATRDPFVIKTSGRDENNFPFQRISRTIVPGRIGPPVYIPIENTVFWENEGNPLVLPCPFRTLVSVRVLWRRDVYLLYNEPGYETGSNGRLFIVSTNRSDAGLYRCQIQSSEHDVFGQVLQVNIATVPVIEDLQNVMVEPGKDAVFTCKVEGIPNPKITWLYGDRSGRTKKNRLIISNANMSDIGPVTCIATNRAGSTNKTAMLDIGSIPRVALKPNKIAVNKGETVQFTCTANGFPRPTVSWYRNNVLLTDSVSGDQAEKQLTAFSVTFQDRGEYACRATNKHGVVEKVAILNVFMRPVLLKGPSDQTALVSQIITMECIVDGTPEPRIIWRHEGTVIKKKTKNIDIRNNGRMLVIGNAQLSHRGVYRCTGRSDRGKVVAQGFLRVIDPPRITRRFATVSGILDKAVDLITSVSGYPAPSLMWYNGGNNLPVGHRFTMHGNGTLTIQNIQMSDEGNYTLVASNDGGNDTATIYLTINYAPYFFAVPVNVSVVAGNRAVLDCSGKGIPTPVVNWTKLVDGIPQHLPEGGSQLIFYAAQLSDAGIYACALQNIYGQVTASIHLNVIVPPRIIRTETTIATPIYSSVWLNCNATGVPTPNVIWVKDALPLVSDQKTFSIFANGSLHIHNSTKADFGNYQCVAINDGGRDNITLYLDVQGPPRLTAVPTNESLLIGSPLEWSCEATGNPNPSVSWLKNGQKLESKLSLVIASNGTKVTVTKVDLSHSGQYTCKANNSLGEDSTSVYLSVLVPPTMLTVSYVAGLLHSKVLLPCEADGVPKPEILWKLNENILKNDHKYVIFDNGTLGIDSLMESDGSVYECHAVNVVGNVSRHITLDVHIPASITSLVNHEVLLGRNLSLTCSASGNPQPTISWYKDGILIDSTTGVELKDHGTTLVIHKAEQHHAGRYTCQAVNVVTNMLAQQNIAVDSSSEVIVLGNVHATQPRV
jgi:hemicentin